MKRLTSLFVIFLLVTLLPLSAWAAAAGKITRVMGKVDILSIKKEIRPAKVGNEVWEGEIVRTKSRSRAQITFIDGSIMRMARNSKVKISKYRISEKRTRGILNLFEGKIQNIVKKTAGYFGRHKANRYEVHTPTAVCGVRGTDFLVSHINGITQSAVKAGIVYAFSHNMPEEEREVRAGQSMVVVAADKPPIIRPATDKDLMLEDDEDEPAPYDSDDQKGSNLGGMDGDLVSDGDTIDDPPSFGEPTTLFEATLSPGFIDGTLAGQISDINDKGAFTVTGEYLGGTATGSTAVQSAVGKTSEGGAFGGYLNGVVGSWEGLFAGLWISPLGEAGYVYSLLSGSIAGTALTSEGEAFRSKTLGSVDSATLSDWAPGPFPVNHLPEVTSLPLGTGTVTSQISGIETNNGQRWLGVWSTITSGGSINPAYHGTSTTYLSGNNGGSYYSLGYLTVTDDGAGHIKINPFADRPITYIDNQFLGSISTWYRGVHDGSGGSYSSVGAGTFTLDRMKYSGIWSDSQGTLFANNAGDFTVAGSDNGRFGGLASPWDSNSADLFAMGELSINPAYSDAPLLWNSALNGTGLNSSGGTEGEIKGYTGGHWRTNGQISGYAAGIYLAPDGRAGLLSGNVGGNWFAGPDMWSAGGTLASTYHETVNVGYEGYSFGNDTLSGNMLGNFTGNGIIKGANVTLTENHWTYLTDGTTRLPWGAYNLKLGSGNRFARSDPAHTTWSAGIGGRIGGDVGYYTGTTNGTWDAAGEINGQLSATWLTRTHFGTMGGPFFGHNLQEELNPPIVIATSPWIGESIGTYVPTVAFDFSSDWGYGESGKLFTYGGGMFSIAGNHNGIVGGISGDSGMTVWAKGSYGFNSDYGEAPAHYFSAWSEGKDVGADSNGPGFGLATVGIADDNNNMTGAAVAIRYDAAGNPALYTGRALTGSSYPLMPPSDGLWELTGALVPGTAGFSERMNTFLKNEGSYDGEYGGGAITVTEIAAEPVKIPDQPYDLAAMALTGTANGHGGSTSTLWRLATEFNTPDGDRNFAQVQGNNWDMQTPGTEGTPANAFGGGLSGAWVNFTIGGTGIFGGEIHGMFNPGDPNNTTEWVAGGTVTTIDTIAFLDSYENSRSALAAMDVPNWQVGLTNFVQNVEAVATGNMGGTLTGVGMHDVGFFAMSPSGAPTVWATQNVGGNYTGNPIGATAVLESNHITGPGLDFTMVQWGANGNWGATVQGGGTVAMESPMDGSTIQMNGGAAGTINTSGGTFSGTGAGTVTSATALPPQEY